MVTEIDGIPVYELKIGEGEKYGISKMSFVDRPAVGKKFLALSEQKKQRVTKLKLSIDEDRHIVTGVALRADHPIYRYDEETGEEYYFVITPDEMMMFIERFMMEKRGDLVNLQHDPKMDVDSIFLIESFIFSDKHSLVYPEFNDVEPGSWMVSYKVHNQIVWDLIKSGRLNGFSPELIGDLCYIGNPDTYRTEEEELQHLIKLIEIYEKRS